MMKSTAKEKRKSTMDKNIIEYNKITNVPNITLLCGKSIIIQSLVRWRQ